MRIQTTYTLVILVLFTATQSNIVHHHVQLEPGAAQDCITYNITLEQELTFFVTSPDAAVEIVNPNGTIFSKCLSLHSFCC